MGLRLTEERFQLLVEQVADYAIFMLDPDGTVATWNLGAERTKGYTADEIVGRHYRTFFTPEDQQAGLPERALAAATAAGRYQAQGTRVRKDGSRFVADVVITALHDADGAPIGFAKVTRDITERSRMSEEREQLAADRIEFLAATAHELRTPVTLISGSAAMLHEYWREMTDEDRTELIATLVRGTDRLRRLVEDLLLTSRLEAGGIELRIEELDVVPIIREQLADHGRTAPEATFELVSPDRLVARADRGRLEQMLANYLSNALRHGAPPVTVTAGETDGWVDIAVADRGPGVPDEAVPSLFDKFAHGEHNESTGLGLHLVRAMAHAQGGDAWYVADTDGPRFVVRLPAG
jgi:PAS domain S-box-containing protein